LLLLGSLVCGAAIAHAVMPHVFRAFPLASIGVETAVSALRDEAAPDIVLFGSSITASGVDPQALSRGLSGNPRVYNLASPAQTLAESVLIGQDLPKSTRVVVQELSPWELVTVNPFAPNKLNAYFSFGYQPTERTIDILGEVFGESMVLTLRSSEAMHTFRSRWVVSRLLDASFWLNLNNQLEMEETLRDVSFFAAEQGRVDDRVMAILVSKWAGMFSDPKPEIFARKRRLMELTVGELGISGRKVLVYVPPIHPQIRARISMPFSEWLDALLETAREAGADTINLAADESESEFHDALHLSAAAAARTTQALARRLTSP
ncbi:MAG: hypothetical protein ACREQJ_05700, partial [Candidatus Binatia bacterium]